MRNFTSKKLFTILAAVTMFLGLASFAPAQTPNQGALAQMQVTYTVQEYLTAVVSGSIVMPSQAMVGSTGGASITLSWGVNPSQHTKGIFDGFSFSGDGSGTTIAYGAINLASVGGGTASGILPNCGTGLTPPAGNNPFAFTGGCYGATDVSQATLNSTPVGSIVLTPSLEWLNTASIPTVPGNYTGILNYVAWTP